MCVCVCIEMNTFPGQFTRCSPVIYFYSINCHISFEIRNYWRNTFVHLALHSHPHVCAIHTIINMFLPSNLVSGSTQFSTIYYMHKLSIEFETSEREMNREKKWIHTIEWKEEKKTIEINAATERVRIVFELKMLS